jgi:HlyD family secretion protein/adhesin transport system membrane fusion protein
MFATLSRSERQSRYLSQAIQLEEAVNPAIIRSTMITVSFAIIVFLGWAAVTNINEVARTPGEVVPKGYQQVVQSLESGTVREIDVREGQEVQKGDKLLVLDAAGAQEDLARTISKQVGFGLEEERLRAFMAGRAPDFSKYEAEHPALVRDQKAFFDGMVQSREEERGIVQEQIVQKQRTIAALQAQLDTARNNHAITKNLYERRAELNRKGYASDIQFLQTKQNLNSIEGEIRELTSRIAVARSEIAEFQNRLQSVDAKYRDDASEKLSALMADKAQNVELISQTRQRVERLEVRAPAHGIVKGLAVNTIGAVIQPGATIMEIVPLDEKLMVQVRIPPQHIGHVRIGQQVEMKFSSFDFARYGVVPGRLEQVSASTFRGENGERYYQGLITLDRNYAGHDPANVVMPGMTVMAEIITGRKTVLDYLLKPIHIAMKTAFTER